MTSLPASPDPAAGRRMFDIDRAKGLGIALVVLGHVMQKRSDPVPPEFLLVVRWIYSFHMPFFMYLSGFVFFHMLRRSDPFDGFARYLARRADRLLVPFAVFGLLIVLAKYAAEGVMTVSDSVKSPLTGIWAVVTNAPDNPNTSIWYILVLFIYSAVTPLLWRLSGKRILLLLIVGLGLHFLVLPEAFYIGRSARYYLFFCLGGAACLHWDGVAPVLRRHALPLLLIFAVVVGIFSRYPVVALFMCGIASMPALHGLMLSAPLQRDRVLLMLGAASMTIYLLNTLFIGLARALFLGLPAQQHGAAYGYIYVAILFAAGLLGPLAVRRALHRIPHLGRIRHYMA